MSIGRYYFVDANKKILGGPLRLEADQVPDWPTPPGATVITEAAMQAGGYAWPVQDAEPATVLRGKLGQALAGNAVFLANAAPSNAQILQQVRFLTRECNGLIRLAAQLLDDTADT